MPISSSRPNGLCPRPHEQGARATGYAHFNLPPDSAGFQELATVLEPVIREGATTLSTKDGRYANLYDNIWYRRGHLPIAKAWIDRFPERLRVSHEDARRHISDHAPVAIRLGKEEKAESPARSYVCGAKRTCGEMASCAEARFYLEQCGLSRLDRDGDGVPCESLCR